MDLIRLFSILIFFSMSAALYIYLGIKVVKNNNNVHTRYLSGFYLSQSVMIVGNLIYIFIFIEMIVHFLYLLILVIGCTGFGFILITTVFLERDARFFIKWKNRLYYLLAYAIIMTGIFFIPNGLTINERTNWRPVYSLHFAIFLIIVNFVMSIIPIVIISIGIFKSMLTREIKYKFGCFSLSLYLYFFALFSIVILNSFNMILHDIVYILIGFIIIPSAYLMYYGTKGFKE